MVVVACSLLTSVTRERARFVGDMHMVVAVFATHLFKLLFKLVEEPICWISVFLATRGLTLMKNTLGPS